MLDPQGPLPLVAHDVQELRGRQLPAPQQWERLPGAAMAVANRGTVVDGCGGTILNHGEPLGDSWFTMMIKKHHPMVDNGWPFMVTHGE